METIISKYLGSKSIFNGAKLMGAVGALAPTVFLPCPEITYTYTCTSLSTSPRSCTYTCTHAIYSSSAPVIMIYHHHILLSSGIHLSFSPEISNLEHFNSCHCKISAIFKVTFYPMQIFCFNRRCRILKAYLSPLSTHIKFWPEAKITSY